MVGNKSLYCAFVTNCSGYTAELKCRGGWQPELLCTPNVLFIAESTGVGERGGEGKGAGGLQQLIPIRGTYSGCGGKGVEGREGNTKVSLWEGESIGVKRGGSESCMGV